MYEMDRFKRDLPVELTLEEIKTKADVLAKTCIRITEIQDEKKITNAELNDSIKSLQKVVARLCTIVKQGFEDRQVDCVKIGYFENNTVQIMRTDNARVIETRAMTSDEREAMAQLDFLKNREEERVADPAPEAS